MESKINAPRDIRFLLIDDMSFYLSFLIDGLKNLGFCGEFLTAHNVTESIKVIEGEYKNKRQIDFIISDLKLPDAPGTILLQKVRKNAILANIPFLLITVEDKSMNIIDAFEHGVSNFMFKPIDIKILGEKIQFCWEKHHLNKKK